MGKILTNRPKSAVEVFKLLPEGIFCQVIDNVIYMSPAPTFEHQNIVAEIITLIRLYVRKMNLGKCVSLPIDVFLNKNNAFQPDIIFLSTKNLSLIGKDGKIHGAPDIVIELLSTSNENDDRVKKKNVYESCGVKEYFIVEPSVKNVISYYLVDRKFEPAPQQKGKIASRLLKKTFKF